ncbi:MAG: DUF721 domain-containing protein [Bacteroidales bacterium]|nr:DUF721 domain-containing protein [Bacteroidales bacterium]
MKSSNEQKLGEAIKELLETYKLEGKLNEAKALQAWEATAGKIILKYTKSAFIKNGKLFLRIESSVIRNEILFSREKIINEINISVGAETVREIVLL